MLPTDNERAKAEVIAAGYFTLRIARDCLATQIPDRVLSAFEPAWLWRAWLERFIATEGALTPGSDGVPVVTFFSATQNLRLQQALAPHTSRH